MNFYIKNIILWPKAKEKSIRIIPFTVKSVNVISGESEKGKSALLYIIDYCLGSSKCSIPTGLIRRVTDWFGIIIYFNGREILVARKEPGTEQVSNSIFIRESEKITIPSDIDENCNVVDLKLMLNNYLNLSKIDLKLNESDSQNRKISIRDIISLNFQPQHIVANAYALYYKADTYRNREKLKTIFPYLLGIIDDDILEKKEELKELYKRKNILEKQLEDRKRIVENWFLEIKNYYEVANELGIASGISTPITINDYVDALMKVVQNINEDTIPVIEKGATAKIAERISQLREEEIKIAGVIQSQREKLILLQSLNQSNIEYTNTSLIQNDRLRSVNWFEDNFNNNICPFCNSANTNTKEYLDKLIYAKRSLDQLSDKISDSFKVFGKEISDIKANIFEAERTLNENRKEQKRLFADDSELKMQRQTLNSIYRFGGQLDEALKNYQSITKTSSEDEELTKLESDIEYIEKTINQNKLKEQQDLILRKIGRRIGYYAKILNAGLYDSHIVPDITNLTLEFDSGNNRKDFLWEIGSGHNFMAYHVASMLAFHEFFISLGKKCKVPSFLIFDQPSQVYFPEMKNNSVKNDDDIIRLKNLFKAFSTFALETKYKVQLIIIEHAGERAWADLENIKLIKRWRKGEKDDALIPKDWLQ